MSHYRLNSVVLIYIENDFLKNIYDDWIINDFITKKYIRQSSNNHEDIIFLDSYMTSKISRML